MHGLNARVIESIIQSVDNEEEFVPPAAWSWVSDLVHMIDMIMHLLGLGVAKAVNRDLIQTWLTQHKVFSSFNQVAAGKLESVKALQLSWCKAMPMHWAQRQSRLMGL